LLIIEEILFAKNNPMKNTEIPEIIIVAIIIIKSDIVIFVRSCWTAADAPVLVFWIAKAVTKLKDITIMFIAPTRKRKDFGFVSVIWEPKTAACPEPMPGRKEHNGAEIAAARVDLRNSFLERKICFNLGIFCSGICILSFIEMKRFESPNRPVSKGNRGSFTGRENVKNPRKPERMNIISAGRNSDSLKIKNKEIKMRIKGIIDFIRL
jgi:hypothetical protein